MPDYHKYESYRDTEIPWLGQIPSPWQLVLLSQVVTQVKNKNTALQENNLLSLSYGRIKRKPIDSSGGLLPESFDGYNIIEENDIVLRLTDLQNDHTSLRVGISPEKGIITSAYTTMRPRNNTCAKYLFYLLHTFDVRKGFYGMGSGVRQGLNYDEVKRLQIPWPTVEEQIHISEYLDRKIDKINTIISEAKASIEEYKAWKASIIYEAVTKGLDPNAEMKESGIAWIGTIPKAWKLIKLKYLMDVIVDCPHETPDYSDTGKYFVIRTADQDVGYLRSDQKMYRLNEAEYSKRIRRLSLNKNDIVYGREGERWGLACIVPESDKYCLGQRMMQFRCNDSVFHPEFARWALNSYGVYMQGFEDTIGSTSPHVNISTIRDYSIPVPTIEEQKQIAGTITKKCDAIVSLITEKEKLIADLESYKKSLIFEVVTGKRRVC